MFTIIQTTIDSTKEVQLAKTSTMPKFRGNGPILMKHIYDKIGPGSDANSAANEAAEKGQGFDGEA